MSKLIPSVLRRLVSRVRRDRMARARPGIASAPEAVVTLRRVSRRVVEGAQQGLCVDGQSRTILAQITLRPPSGRPEGRPRATGVRARTIRLTDGWLGRATSKFRKLPERLPLPMVANGASRAMSKPGTRPSAWRRHSRGWNTPGRIRAEKPGPRRCRGGRDSSMTGAPRYCRPAGQSGARPMPCIPWGEGRAPPVKGKADGWKHHFRRV